MSKQLAKFQASYKKIAPLMKNCSSDDVENKRRSFSLAYNDTANTGEIVLGESTADARDNGVTGDKLSDFLKDKSFKDGLATFTKAVHQTEKLQKDLMAACDRAAKAAGELTKLKAEIDKDLKSRKDKSESKSDIEKLKAKVEADLKDMRDAAAVYGRMDARAKNYCNDYEKHIARILKQAPEAQKDQRDSTKLPQMLVDRNRKKLLSQASVAAKKVTEACDAAVKAAGADLKAAQPHLKAASAALKTLTDLRDQYKTAVAYADKKNALDKTKDEDAVRKVLAQVEKLLSNSERTLRGTATTIKKAAV